MMMRSRFAGFLRATSRGFTLIEVVVALVIVLVLAAVALPQVDGYLQQKRVDATFDQLDEVRTAIAAFNASTGAYPGRLSELSSPIIPGNAQYNTGTDDSCGATFSNAERNSWNADGPFVSFLVDRDFGMVTPIGAARDSLTRLAAANVAGDLRINFMNGVSLQDAELLDELHDGNTGFGNGFVRWDLPAVDGMVTMYYRVPIGTAC
jgi:prepilin-type N-terminal cleavage/methylation domain-containing protein